MVAPKRRGQQHEGTRWVWRRTGPGRWLLGKEVAVKWEETDLGPPENAAEIGEIDQKKRPSC